MFGVPKHLALKMTIKRNNNIIKLHKAQFLDWSNKNKEKCRKNAKICNILCPKTPE